MHCEQMSCSYASYSAGTTSLFLPLRMLVSAAADGSWEPSQWKVMAAIAPASRSSVSSGIKRGQREGRTQIRRLSRVVLRWLMAPIHATVISSSNNTSFICTKPDWGIYTSISGCNLLSPGSEQHLPGPSSLFRRMAPSAG